MQLQTQQPEDSFVPQKLVFNGMPPVEPRSVTIASLDFLPKTYRAAHSNRHTFTIAASDGKTPSYITVYDSQQFVPNNQGSDEPATMIPMPTPVDVIAADMIAQWTGGGIGALNRYPPGVMQIAGKTANDAEMRQMRMKQERRCRMLVEEADKFHKTGKGEILEAHRLALQQLDSERRDWFKPIEQGKSKMGAISGKRIPMMAMQDDGQDLLEFYIKYDFKPLDYEDTYVAELLKKRPELYTSIRQRLGISATK